MEVGTVRISTLYQRLFRALAPGLFVMVVAASMMMLAGCNTVEGAGKDIERAGEGIQDAAK